MNNFKQRSAKPRNPQPTTMNDPITNMPMESKKLSYLSNIHIFRDLAPTELAALDQQIAMSTCEAGRIFYTPEEKSEVLFLLKKGRVQLYRLTPNGKKLIVAVLGAGAVFGEMSFIGQGMNNSYAQAIEECVLCVMGRADIERLIHQKPDVAFRFAQAFGARLQELEQRLEALAFKSISARLATLLLRLAGEQKTPDVVVGYTHQDLSELLGTYRETVTQTLNEWKMQGIIEIGRKRVYLRQPHALQMLANEEK